MMPRSKDRGEARLVKSAGAGVSPGSPPAALQDMPRLTTGCRRRQTASAHASLPLSAAPEPQRSADEGDSLL